MDKKHGQFEVFRTRHEAAWQFIKYMLIGLITTCVEMGSFVLLNFLVFVPFRNQHFSWWIIDYTIENGGLTAFLAFALSFAIAQTFNFFLQRKTTFKANNNVARSAVMYAVMIVLIYFLQLYLPTLIRARIVAVLGWTFGDIVTEMINMMVSMLIQFPLSKWVIMRRSPTVPLLLKGNRNYNTTLEKRPCCAEQRGSSGEKAGTDRM